MTVEAIIEKLGGLSAFADALAVPVTTASSWKSKNYIPAWRQRDVLELALTLKQDISAADFPERAARLAA